MNRPSRLPALVSVVVVQAMLLALLALIVPGFRFDEPVAVIPAAIVITLAQSVVWPVIYGIAVRFGPWLFPFVGFILTGWPRRRNPSAVTSVDASASLRRVATASAP